LGSGDESGMEGLDWRGDSGGDWVSCSSTAASVFSLGMLIRSCCTALKQFGLVFVLDIGNILNYCNGSSIAAADADGCRCCCDADNTT